MRRFVIFLALLGAMSAPLYALSSPVMCGFSGSPGDHLNRGIVAPGYPGNNVGLVELAYGAATAGTYGITLQIRRGSFAGPLVGSAQTAYVTLPADLSHVVHVTFNFGGAPVTPGDTLTFLHTVTLPPGGNIFFDTGTGTCSSGSAYETEFTVPPLDTLRHAGMGINVFANDVLTSCIPSDTVMCIDNNPGDRRFQLALHFSTSQSGGLSGEGQEVPQASLGITQGGLFWFFSQSNPEMLVKVINACGVNNKFWVFFSAGTNVAFTLTVKDTATGQIKTYTNPDLHAAAPVQDTSAFACP